jgi:hypothetical protein
MNKIFVNAIERICGIGVSVGWEFEGNLYDNPKELETMTPDSLSLNMRPNGKE